MDRKKVFKEVVERNLKNLKENRNIDKGLVEIIENFINEFNCLKSWINGKYEKLAKNFLSKIEETQLKYGTYNLFIAYLWDRYIRFNLNKFRKCKEEILIVFDILYPSLKKTLKFSFESEGETKQELMLVYLSKIEHLIENNKQPSFPQLRIILKNATIDRLRKILKNKPKKEEENNTNDSQESEDRLHQKQRKILIDPSIKSIEIFDEDSYRQEDFTKLDETTENEVLKLIIVEDKLTELTEVFDINKQKLLCIILKHDCKIKDKLNNYLSSDALHQRISRFRRKELKELFLKWESEGLDTEDIKSVLNVFSNEICPKICQE